MDEKKTSVSAIVALVVGIIALLLSAVPIVNNFAFVLAIFGLVLGIVGLVKIKKGKRKGSGLAISSIVISTLAFVVVLASQAMYGAVLDEASKAADKAAAEASSDLDKATGNSTDELLKNDVTVKLGAFKASQDQYGIDSTELPVTVTNKNADKKSYSVQVEAVDNKGNRIVDDTVYANDLKSGQSQSFKAFQYVESGKLEAVKSAKFQIVSVSQS